MKPNIYIGIFLSLSFFMLTASKPLFAQQRQWHLSAVIPEDSINAARLIFTDSLHGYFWGARKLGKGVFAPRSYKEFAFYRTIDGGSTWGKIDFRSVFGSDAWKYDSSYEYVSPNFATTANSGYCLITNIEGGGQPYFDTIKFYLSTNYGATWTTIQTSPITRRGNFRLVAMPQEHQIITQRTNSILDDTVHTEDIGKLYISVSNGGRLGSDLRWDSTLLKNIVSPPPPYKQNTTPQIKAMTFDYFDEKTWIITSPDSSNATGNKGDTTRPYTLVTLLTTDAGHSWTAYRNIISQFPSIPYLSGGSIQCVRGTSYVYSFTGRSEGGSAFGNALDRGFPVYGVNFFYSSDYGKTWTADTSFVKNRRGYEPVAPGDIWFTVVPHDSVEYNTPAYWIVHSTDFGKTLAIDSLSLLNDIEYDARSVTFSDPRHGWIFAQTLDRHQVDIFKYIPQKNNANLDYYSFRSKEMDYRVYPNPANNEVTIQVLYSPKITGLEVFDILGRKQQFPYVIAADYKSTIIHTEELRSGCYLAHVSMQERNYIIPFVVQH